MRRSVSTMTFLPLLMGTFGAVWIVYANEKPIEASALNEVDQRDAAVPDGACVLDLGENAICSSSEGASSEASTVRAYIPTPRPLADGTPIEQRSAPAEGGDVGAMAESSGSFLVYSNTLSKQVTGPAGPAATGRIADDVATTAPVDCPLDKYVVRVTGDRENTGSSPDFTVTTALYRVCPGASAQPTAITGTTCTFSGLSGTGVHELTCAAATNVKLPDNFYVGVSFSRDNCGVIVGAPPELGFSADRFDWPGFPCSGWFGGYPDYRHASLWLQVYTTEACEKSFVGYKNSNHAGNAYSPGAAVYYADDIKLGVPQCNMIAYEVAVKGAGVFKFDLRTFLSNSNPETGGVIPGTERMVASGDAKPQLVRFAIDPPISLNPNFYISFKSSSGVAGPIFTDRRASIGTTADLFCVYRGGEWDCGPLSATTYAAFDVTIMCEGEPRVGACCDMVQRDAQGEAVCRQLPEMNCGFQPLWVERDFCNDICQGGTNNGRPCTREADCPGANCVGGSRNGLLCDPSKPVSTECPGTITSCKRAKCPGPFAFPCGQSACCTYDDFCYNYTQNECYARPPVDRPRSYHRAEYCGFGGFACPSAHCPWDVYDYCPWEACDAFCCGACCQKVCDADWWCCNIEWDWECTALGYMICDLPVRNDECWAPNPLKGARLVDVPSSTESDSLHATENETDSGFCCNNTRPGAAGFGTVWYKFVATETTASLKTCFSNNPANDSLISVYMPADPDRGICGNGAQCSVAANNCSDLTTCVPDGQYACQHLNLIGCSDDVPGCSVGSKNSWLCLTNLVIGRTYYVLVAHKTDPAAGITKLAYRLDVSSPCTSDKPPIPNDYCQDATELPGRLHVVEPFDLSGGGTYAPATFHCPGEPCVDPVMQNDLWYTWTAPCSGPAKITTCHPELAPWDQPYTAMAVYDSCNCPVQVGTAVACNAGTLDDCGLSATVEFDARDGQCYMIRLGGHLGAEPSGKLTITCDATCPPGPVEWLDPPNGVIDARQPHPIDVPTSLRGIDTIKVRAPERADTGCWTLCETNESSALHPPYPPELQTNDILNVQSDGSGTYTIKLKRPITPGEVTALTYTDDTGSTSTATFISHPANVNGDTVANAVDILAMIDILNGVAVSPWGVYSSDIDHSGIAAPADILAVIDLLNHGWSGTPLPSGGGHCP